jgi:hypothetical protein
VSSNRNPGDGCAGNLIADPWFRAEAKFRPVCLEAHQRAEQFTEGLAKSPEAVLRAREVTAMQIGALRVQVEGEHIVVTTDGSSFRAVYYLAEGDAKLLQSEGMGIDNDIPKEERKEIETLAWEAANAKARELGWL